MQPGLLAPPIVTSQYYKEGAHNLSAGPEALDRAQQLLTTAARAENTLSGQNIAYDFACYLAQFPHDFPLVWNLYKRGQVFDLGIACFLDAVYDGRVHDDKLFNRDNVAIGRYSLKEVVKETLGREDAKQNDRFRLSYAMLEGVPLAEWPSEAREYPVDDARNGYEAGKVILEGSATVPPYDNLCDHRIQAWAAFCMHLGAVHGLRTDPARVQAVTGRVTEEIATLKEEAAKRGFFRLEKQKGVLKYVKNTKHLKQVVSAAYGGSPPRTEKGEVSCERVVLEDSGDPELQKLTEISKLEKFCTYFSTLQQGTTLPINVQSNPVLVTGRASYEGLVQLMPRKGGIRECFVPREGFVFSTVDFAAVELSTLAQVCLWTVGQSKLAEAINGGIDPHSLLGSNMVNVPYEVFLSEIKAEVSATADIRQGAKAGNFGFPGMMGEAKFVIAKRREGMRVCELFYHDGQCSKEKVAGWRGRELPYPLCVRCLEKARFIREYYLQTWSEVQLYWKWIEAELERNDEKLTQFISGRVRGGLNPPAAANTLFQGLAADGAKRALIALTEHMYLDTSSPLYGSRLVVFAHDETILEIPEHKSQLAAPLHAQIMVDKMAEVCPDVRISADPTLMRRWYKEAKPVWVDGKIVPWEPKEKHRE